MSSNSLCIEQCNHPQSCYIPIHSGMRSIDFHIRTFVTPIDSTPFPFSHDYLKMTDAMTKELYIKLNITNAMIKELYIKLIITNAMTKELYIKFIVTNAITKELYIKLIITHRFLILCYKQCYDQGVM